MKRSVLAICSLLALALLVWICISFHAPLIEKDIKGRLTANLFARDLDTVQVKISGRDVHLKGQITSKAAAGDIRQVAAKTKGVRKITDDFEIIPITASPPEQTSSTTNQALEVRPPQLLLSYDGGQLKVDGAAPDHQFLSQLKDHLNEKHAFSNIQANLEVRAFEVAGWPAASQALASALLDLNQGEALLEEKRWQLSSTVSDSEKKTQIRSQLFRSIPRQFKGNLDLKLQLSASNLACQEALDTLLQKQKLLFKTSSADITPESKPVLQEIANIAKGCPDIFLKIAGHTDASGQKELNQTLSQSRADTVKAFLIQAGLNADKVSAIGFGSAFPIANNDNEEGRAQNRRIEIIVLETSP